MKKEEGAISKLRTTFNSENVRTNTINAIRAVQNYKEKLKDAEITNDKKMLGITKVKKILEITNSKKVLE